MQHRLTEKIQIWAAKTGWKQVALAIAQKENELVGKPAGENLDANHLHALVQRIKRIYTVDSPTYEKKREEMTEAALAALPAKKRLEVVDPFGCELKISEALESFGNAMSAISIKCPTASTQLMQTISRLESLFPIVQMFT